MDPQYRDTNMQVSWDRLVKFRKYLSCCAVDILSETLKTMCNSVTNRNYFDYETIDKWAVNFIEVIHISLSTLCLLLFHFGKHGVLRRQYQRKELTNNWDKAPLRLTGPIFTARKLPYLLYYIEKKPKTVDGRYWLYKTRSTPSVFLPLFTSKD